METIIKSHTYRVKVYAFAQTNDILMTPYIPDSDIFFLSANEE